MLQNLELEKAIEILISRGLQLNSENVTLQEAHGRVLSEDIYSSINQPPFDRSPLDGYALISEDSANATKENPVKLKVIEEVMAGQYPKEEVKRQTAVRIMTGAAIPKGANCVIKQEDTFLEEEFVSILRELSPNQNICFKGEDIKEGELVLNKNTTLNYSEIGILASLGINKIKVYEKAVIGIVNTGNELIEINEKISEGKIYNSNRYTLYSRIKELGFEPVFLGIAKDSSEETSRKILEALENCHILITTGGVSVGKKDIVKEVMDGLGAEALFWKVKIKPGSPVFCSFLNNKLIISLSGNPAAAITTFEVLVKPYLAEVTNRKELRSKCIKAKIMDDFNKKGGMRRFVRGFFSYTDEGGKVSLTKAIQGNGMLSTSLNSNCLIDIEENSPVLNSGDVVKVILI